MLGVHQSKRVWDKTLFASTAKNTAVQFFLDHQVNPRLKELTEHASEIAAATKIANARNITPVIHLPFTITLATLGRPYFKTYVKRAAELAKAFTQQSYIIMHLGGPAKLDPALVAWIEKTFPTPAAAETTHAPSTPMLTFENMIRFTTVAKLKKVYTQLRTANVGFCIDLAHLWGGKIDVRSGDKMQHEYTTLKDAINVVMYHLNPPKMPFGKVIDRHGDMDTTPMDENVMRVLLNNIWADKLIGIIERPTMPNVTKILELWRDAQKRDIAPGRR